jgi:hypothetical protein
VNWPPAPAPVFPALIPQGFPVKKIPLFAATEHKSVTGRMYQSARQVYPNWQFELQFGEESWLREQTQNISPYAPNAPHVELEAISQLFLTCYGAYGEFYFDDLEDDSRMSQAVATGDGVTTVFRIYRTWGSGPLARVEPVGGVNLGQMITVYLNGTPLSSSLWTVTNDLSGSHVNFTTAPSAGVAIAMDFSFYYRCRFTDDSQNYEQFLYNLWQLKSCKFQSCKP